MVFSLGLSPLADIEDGEFRSLLHLRLWFKLAYRDPVFNRFMYPLRGHNEFKRDFRGTPEKVYFATDKRMNFGHVFRLLRACKLL